VRVSLHFTWICPQDSAYFSPGDQDDIESRCFWEPWTLSNSVILPSNSSIELCFCTGVGDVWLSFRKEF
jgi:hypothetical protein